MMSITSHFAGIRVVTCQQCPDQNTGHGAGNCWECPDRSHDHFVGAALHMDSHGALLRLAREHLLGHRQLVHVPSPAPEPGTDAMELALRWVHALATVAGRTARHAPSR